ncbi:MAG: hypothetical protein HYZ72_09795, partial [Deltaproteobacteria bacterium]|nr:hypothetical protein [Deltaproteobacteria bacterium]
VPPRRAVRATVRLQFEARMPPPQVETLWGTVLDVSPTGMRVEYLRGVTNEQVVILDVERILSDERLIVGGDEVEL